MNNDSISLIPEDRLFAGDCDGRSDTCNKEWVDNNGTGEKTVITGTGQPDMLNGCNPAEDISGLAGDDRINAGSGDDVLDGGTGKDAMHGGRGDDVYYADNISDKVIECPEEGNDHVFSSISYTLPDNTENVHLLTDNDLNAVGNKQDNVLHGNDGNNGLNGGEGNDNLYGHAGNDILDGESGADYMAGGEGNDIYYVDSTCDRIIECTGEGTDTVYSSVDYAAGHNIENLTLLNDDDLNLIGNGLDNVLHGNGGNNILLGGDGGDRIFGHDGNDFINGGSGNDLLDGGFGFDTYLFDCGTGCDTIQDYDPSESSSDRIVFGSGIGACDLELSRSGCDLVIGLKNSDNALTVSQWFEGSEYQIEEFRFNGGEAWNFEKIQEATDVFYTGTATDGLDSIQQQAQAASGTCC